MLNHIMEPDDLLIKKDGFYLFYEMMMQSLKTLELVGNIFDDKK